MPRRNERHKPKSGNSDRSALGQKLDETFRISMEKELKEFSEDHNQLGKKYIQT